MSEHFKPFRQIPRYPAEGSAPAEPRTEGAPASTADSVFLTVPELAATAHAAVGFSELNRAGRDRLTDRYVRLALTNPNALIHFFDAAQTLEESGMYPSLVDMQRTIEEALDRMQTKDIPSAPAMEEWLTIYTESAAYKPLAEKILRRFVERAKSPKELIDVLYPLAEGGLGSSNHKVLIQTLHVLGFETPILTPDSPQGEQHLLALFHTDDAVLKKAMEIDGAFFYLAHAFEPELLERLNGPHEIINARPSFLKAMGAMLEADPARFKKLTAHYSRATESGGLTRQEREDDTEEFPMSLAVHDIGPLRIILNEFMADHVAQREPDGSVIANVDLPGYSGVRGSETIAGIGKIVGEYTQRPRETVLHLDRAKHIRALSYMVPESTNEFTEWQRIADANTELRTEMAQNSRYLLSPRGDQVEITDAVLAGLGFTDVTFQMDPRNKRQTVVTLRVGNNCEFRLLLDEHFAVREVASQRGIRLPQHGAFLENVVLSHLREIRCSERVNEVAGSATAKPAETRRAFTSRRAHRRILPEGQSPTPGQITFILGEYDMDLVRMNRERAALGETRKVTYVYEVESVAIAGHGPVRSQTPEATRRLHSLIAAGTETTNN